MSPTSSSFPVRYYLTVAVVLLVFVVVALYSSRMAHDTTGYDEDQAKARLAKLTKMRADDQKTLTTADWIDQAKGTVRIPVAEAMNQEVPLLKAKPVAMGVEIPGAAATTMTTLPATNSASASANPSGTTTNAPTANPASPSVTGTPPALTNAPPAGTSQPPTGATTPTK